jgi:hypothetical protein
MHWRWFIVTEGVKIGKLGSTQEWSFQANRFATPHASTLDHDLGGSLGDCGFDLGFCGVSFEQVMNSAHRQRAVLQGFDNLCSLGAEKIILETEMAEGESAAVIGPTRLPASRVASSYRCNRCEPESLVEPSTTPSSSLSIPVSRFTRCLYF